MEKSQEENGGRRRLWLILLLLAVLILAVLVGWRCLRQKDAKEAAGGSGTVVAWDVDLDPEEDTAGAGVGISIPGYDTMVFAAGETTQSVDMGNPAENACYFIITLELEDGTQLFQSDYLEPGEGFEEIELGTALEAGEYTGIIRYQCYSLEDKSSLNGASSEFQLIVQ